MNVVFAGKGRALVSIILFAITKLQLNNIFILPVESDCGQEDWQVSVFKLAQIKKLSLISLDDAKQLNNAVFISVQYDKILRPEDFLTKKIFNIHFSYLPFYKGVYPVVWPILNQESYSGVTLHRIDNGIDTGNIIDQEKVFLNDSITSFELYQKCCEESLNVFKRNFDNIISNLSNNGTKQQNCSGSYYSKKSLDLGNYKIDLRKTACEVSSQLRSMMFKPYQMPNINDTEVNQVEITQERDYVMAGKILSEDDTFFKIATIDYIIKVKKDHSKKIFSLINEDKNEQALDFIQKYNLVNERNSNGWSPLAIASYHGNQILCEKLVNLGADVNAENFKGTSVLMYAKSYASKTGNLDTTKFLIEKGANINHKDHYGINLIEYAENENNKEIINYLNKFL